MQTAPLILKHSQKLHLKNLKASCIIGVWEHEKENPQPLQIDLTLSYEEQGASQSDDLKDTLNYSDLAKEVLQFVEKSQFQLLESLSYHLAKFIFLYFPVTELHITLHKPYALKNLADISHEACYRA